MLKKLKFKFILINMLLVGVTVLLIFVAVCMLTWRSETEEINRSLELILQNNMLQNDIPPEGDRVPVLDENRPNGNPLLGKDEEILYVSAFSVLVNREGEILQSEEFGTGMDETLLTEAVARVLSEGGETLSHHAEMRGDLLRDINLIYRMREMPNGYQIAFTSADRLYITFQNTALVCGIACAGSLVLFFWVSYFLSGLAIRPIERAWTQQKQFVADASHDLKTPLTVILANANILRGHREERVETQMQWVESTEEEAGRMRALVDRMLELAKSEDAKERLAFSRIAISELTERVILQFEPVAFERGVEIYASVAPEITLQSHEESYVRLVHILLDNAIKYSPVGEQVRVTLEATRGTVRFAVQNRGEVIPREELSHLFERFYRADKARSVGGFGLGLSIAKNLCEGLGGRITVQSDAVNGTVFTVALRST